MCRRAGESLKWLRYRGRRTTNVGRSRAGSFPEPQYQHFLTSGDLCVGAVVRVPLLGKDLLAKEIRKVRITHIH